MVPMGPNHFDRANMALIDVAEFCGLTPNSYLDDLARGATVVKKKLFEEK